MKVLLVESTPGNAVEVRQWLDAEGHECVSCFDSPTTFACRGAVHHDDCALSEPADIALLVRDLDGQGHMLTEMGAVCAIRHRVPLVDIVEPSRSVLDATMRSALADAQDSRHTAGYAMAAREALASAPLVMDGEVGRIDVERDGLHVRAIVHLTKQTDDAIVPMVVDRVGRALRRHDPYASVIDVGVERD